MHILAYLFDRSNDNTEVFKLINLFDGFPVEKHIQVFISTKTHWFGLKFIYYSFVIRTKFQQDI